jgi:hypothetical protein
MGEMLNLSSGGGGGVELPPRPPADDDHEPNRPNREPLTEVERMSFIRYGGTLTDLVLAANKHRGEQGLSRPGAN